MSKFISCFLFSVFIFFCFTTFAAEEKGKLFFRGTVIFPAISDSQVELIKNVDKIIDAELFSARLMPFSSDQENQILKEKSLKCLNIECIASEAEKLGISTIVTSEISIVSDSFKGTMKLYDVGFKTVVAEIQVTGSISDIENNYINLVKNLIAESQSYLVLKNYKKNGNTEGFDFSQFNPIVVLKTEKADGSPEQFQNETKLFPPQMMDEFHDLSDVKNKDLIDSYDQALRADRFGESEPEKATEAWRKVTALAEAGPIKDFSIKRGNEWFLYKKDLSDTEALKTILAKEPSYQLFPDVLVKMWKEYLLTNPGAPRNSFAEKRVAFYDGKASEIKRYTDERAELSRYMKTVYSKNQKAMNLNMVSVDKKVDILLKFLEVYGAVDNDFYYLSKMIDQISNENEKQLAKKNIFNKWNAEFFKNKCFKKDSQACIISEQLFSNIKVFTESSNLQSKGCSAGIPELCASFALSKFENPEDITVEEFAKKSCATGSGKGCFILAKFDELKNFRKPVVPKDVLLKISCERGYVPACPNVEQKSINNNESAAPVEIKKKTVESKKAEKKKDGTESIFLKTHPCFWYGFSSTLAGVALGAVSIYFGYWTDERYGAYNEGISPEKLREKINEPWIDKQEHIKKTDENRSDGDAFKKVAIGAGIAGGALIITGTILMFVKKPQTDSVKLSFAPSPEGFMAGASFSW